MDGDEGRRAKRSNRYRYFEKLGEFDVHNVATVEISKWPIFRTLMIQVTMIEDAL